MLIISPLRALSHWGGGVSAVLSFGEKQVIEITLQKVVSPSPHHTVKRIECSLVHAFFMPFLFCQAMQCALYKYTFISIMLSAFIIEFFLKTEQTGTAAALGYSQPSHYSRQVGIPILGMLTVFSKRRLFFFFFFLCRSFYKICSC